MEVSYVSKKPTMAKQQQSVTVTTRPPLVPSEKNNPVAGRTRTMEVSSRYRSPTPTKTRRCPSPIIVTRTASPSSQSPSKRAVSAERKRSSSTPTTPTYPSTPVSDVSSDLLSRRLSSGRLPESLWPSTMRSLSVSFQSDSVSVKKVKPFVTSPNDRTLRPPSNIAYVTSPNDRTLRPPSNIAYVTSPNDRTLRPHSNIAYVTSPNDRTLRPHIASVTSPNDRALRPSSNIASVTSPNDRTLRPSSNIASVTSPNDRTLRPSSNIAYKQQGETTSVSRKHTPERKRSPLKNVSGQSENSKPVNGPHSRIIEQHQWPSRISETITSNAMSISLDLGDKAVRRMSLPLSKGSKPLQKPPVRRMSLPLSKSSKPLQKPSVRRMTLHLSKIPKPLHKSSSDAARFLSCYENGGLLMSPTNSEDGSSLTWSSSESLRLSSPTSLDGTAIPRFQSAPGSRAASPSRTSLSSSLSSSSSSNSRGMSPSRGVSPLRGLSPSRGTNVTCLRLPTPPPSPSRGANVTCLRSPTPPPSPSRGANVTCLRLPTPPPSPSRGPNLTCLRSPTAPPSPSRIRQTNKSAQSTSVLSFFADVKKGKKATYIEDVHQLRLLYNRYSQWRFANARAEGVRYIQRLIAEETLYNVWHATSDLRDLVTAQRICLQQLKLEIKLESILNYQMVCLDDWGILEREHISSLAGAIGDLEANTLRLSLTGGTKADLGSLKLAMSSALDVMEAMGSSILSLHSQMEETTKLVSDLSVIATEENFMLDKCEDLLASTSVMEIEERSLMTHLIQKKQEEEVRGDAESPLLPLSKFSWS